MADWKELYDSGKPRQRLTSDHRELRLVSVVFCDIVDSTDLSRRLLDEDFQDIIRDFRAVCRELTQAAGGYIEEEHGDAIIASFGRPTAREDEPSRAIQTALEMARAVSSVRVGVKSSLQARIAIASGIVPVGDPDVGVASETTNLAARLHDAAEPGTVVIDEITHKLSQGRFDCTDLGTRQFQGFEGLVQVWRVDRARPFATRFDIKAELGLTPFVGREEQLSVLLGQWQKVCKREGQVILLGGEAGIGKSRLIRKFQERVELNNEELFRLQCSPDHKNTALHPVIDRLKRMLGLEPEDSDAFQVDQVNDFVSGWSEDVARLAPVFTGLLSRSESGYERLERNPEKLRESTQAALIEYLKYLAKKNPCLVVVEDVHWIDPTTQALLEAAIDEIQRMSLMLIVTFRPADRLEPREAPGASRATSEKIENTRWPENARGRFREHVTHLLLGELNTQECSELIDRISGVRTLAVEQHNEIISRGGGVPLYLEELTKSVLESGSVDALRSELEFLLLSRLDPLEKAKVKGLNFATSVKGVAQVAGAIGKEFSLELLREVMVPNDNTQSADAAEKEFQIAMERLLESGLIRKQDNTYRFKHALIRDQAYNSLLRGKRDQLHTRIALMLKDRPGRYGVAPELVAHHCSKARLTTDALRHWHEAGRRAAIRSSNKEAEHHFRRAILASRSLPDALENLRQRLRLCNDLGPVLMASKGFAAPEVEEVYVQGVKLGARIGREADLYFPALAGLQLVRIVQGRHREACELGEECLTIAKETRRSEHLIEAHRHRGAARFWMGKVSESQDDFEQLCDLYDPARHETLKFNYGTDPRVSALVFLSMGSSLVGRFKDAAAHGEQAIALVQGISHRHSEEYANLGVALSHDLRRETHQAGERARTAVQLGPEIPFWAAWAKVIESKAQIEQGDADEKILNRIHEGIEAYDGTGAGLAKTYFQRVLAEAHAASGNVSEALRQLEAGLEMTEVGGERFYEPELLRRKGELLLTAGVMADDVERCFRAALDISNRRGAKLFELRAAVSLSRLLRGQPRQAETNNRIQRLLTDVDTIDLPDVLEAREALECGV